MKFFTLKSFTESCILLVFLAAGLFSVAAVALPQGELVVSGEADFVRVDEGSLHVTTSEKAIINYESFSIGEVESVRFIQPSSKSCVLNRVQGSDPSSILGSMSSNGKVFLVNPNGIYFGPNSSVNVGSLIASTLDILDQDFLNEKFNFHLKQGAKPALIHNLGHISAPEGVVALLAPYIKNEGVITANAGRVFLASAEVVTLDFSGDGLLSFIVEGDLEDAVITQLGNIQAPGGEVFMNVKTAHKAIRDIINTDGVVEGNKIVKENGIIHIAYESTITASKVSIEVNENSTVKVEGQIDASNYSSGGKGGSVQILGDHIRLFGANIDASGDLSGGSVLIGGDYKGEGSIRNAITNIMDESSVIKADAITEGDGGKVILWSDITTFFDGSISAKGGQNFGNGGFVETSGKINLGVQTGRVNALAVNGRTGSWLLDPSAITIGVAGAGTLVQVADCTNTSTSVAISAATINAAVANVVLCVASGGTIIQAPGQSITMNNAGIGIEFKANSGTITTTLNDSVTTNGGGIVFTSSDLVLGTDLILDTTNAGGTAAGANITITGATNDNALGASTLALRSGTGGMIALGSVGSTVAPSTVTLTGNATLNGTAYNVSNANFTVSGTTTLGSDATIATGTGTVAFTGVVNGAYDLTVNTTGATTFSSLVGNIAALSSLTTSAGGTLSSIGITAVGDISLGDTTLSLVGTYINTNADIILSGDLTLTGSVTLSTQTVAGGGEITLSGLVDGYQDLTMNAGDIGTVNMVSNIGSIAPLADLYAHGLIINQLDTIEADSVTYASTAYISGDITAADYITVDDVVIAVTSVLTTASGDISIRGTLNAASTSISLTMDVGTNDVTLGEVVGGTGPLNNLTITGDNITFDGNIGGSAVGVGGSLTVTGDSSITFNGTTYNADNQTYTLSSLSDTYNLDAGVTTTFTTTSGTVSFTGGTVKLSNGTNLVIATTNATVTLENVQADNFGSVTITAGTGAILAGNIGDTGTIGAFTAIGGSFALSESIRSNGNIDIETTGDVTDVGGYVLTSTTSGTITINATGGFVGSASNPLVVDFANASHIVVGSLGAVYINGTIPGGAVSCDPSNPPSFLVINGITSSCSSPVPSPSGSSLPPASILFVAGITTEQGSLAGDMYFLPDVVTEEMLKRSVLMYYETKVSVKSGVALEESNTEEILFVAS